MAKEKQTICPVCNRKLAFLKSTLKDGVKVCAKHTNDVGLVIKDAIEQSTVEDLKERMESSKLAQEQFKIDVDNFVETKRIGNFIAFNDEKERWAVLSPFLGKVTQIYRYQDIVNFELLEDGDSVASGGLGRALAGGFLFGGAGAIVGGVTGKKKTKGVCNSLKLKITVKDISNPVVYVNFIETKTKKDGIVYKTTAETAQECLSVFQLICDRQKDSEKNNPSPVPSSADEIKKFKDLLDEGVISQEEFDQKKKQLLGI